MQQKYIIFNNIHAVLFHCSMVHAGVHYKDLSRSRSERMTPTSAGFFSIGTEVSYETEDGRHWPEGRAVVKVNTFGKSESLNLDSKPSDAMLISIALGIN